MQHYFILLIVAVLVFSILLMIWHVRNIVTSKEVFLNIPLKKLLLSKINNKLKSGDLIYTRSSIGSFQELMIPYLYKHVGIIVEINDVLYIAETSEDEIIGRNKDKLLKTNSGVRLVPFYLKMKNMIGVIFILQLNKPLEKKQNELLQDVILDNYNSPYPSLLYLYFLFIIGISLNYRLFCYTFVYKCLVYIGLVDDNKLSPKEKSKFMTNIYNYKLKNGYSYSYPKQLIYDYECEEESF